MRLPTHVGVISDTHGLLRPEALAALDGSQLIVHAGDVGSPEVLDGLRALAPVVAVRGNNDNGAWAEALPETAEVILDGGARLFVLHDVKELPARKIDPAREGFACVIAGHSHQPRNERVDGVLYLNPGAAGPRRFKLPIAVGRLTVERGALTAKVVKLA